MIQMTDLFSKLSITSNGFFVFVLLTLGIYYLVPKKAQNYVLLIASMQVALAAIGKVCVKDRAAILDAMMATRDLDTVIGKFSFDKNGDPAIATATGYVVNASDVWEETAIKQ